MTSKYRTSIGIFVRMRPKLPCCELLNPSKEAAFSMSRLVIQVSALKIRKLKGWPAAVAFFQANTTWQGHGACAHATLAKPDLFAIHTHLDLFH